MELLRTDQKVDTYKLFQSMKSVKDFLQSIGIFYIDWKLDQIGISRDGT